MIFVKKLLSSVILYGGDQVRLVWWKSESRPSDGRYPSQTRNDNNYALAA